MAHFMSLRSGDLKSSILRTSSRMTTNSKPLNDNLKFYQGKIKSNQGTGYSIDEMLSWKGDYDHLEWNHSYIQWLFPIPESNGLNFFAQALQDHEAEAIKGDTQLKKKVLAAFEMMLDFYGMELTSTKEVSLQRCRENWVKRYDNLNWSSHNYLRITRILKSIGHLGLERLQKSWVSFILYEAIVEKTLPRLNGGSIYHWINAIADPEQRQEVFVLHEQYLLESEKIHKQTDVLEKTNTDTNHKQHENDSDKLTTTTTTTTTVKYDLEPERCRTSKSENRETRDEYLKRKVLQNDAAFRKKHDTTMHEVKHTNNRLREDGFYSFSSSSSTPYKIKASENSISSESVKHDSVNKLKGEANITKLSDVLHKNKTVSETNSKDQNERRASEKEKTTTPQVCDSDWGDDNAMEVDIEETYVSNPADNNANLLFYQCKIRSNSETGADIEEMLTWNNIDKYDILDRDPYYIQWLFPISHSTGRNPWAKPLQTHEAKAIIEDKALRTRYMKAFEMMLAFYGMEMVVESSDLARFQRSNDWRDGFDYLNDAPHNVLRITRILKSIGEFGYSNLQVGWLSYMFEEIFTEKTLTEIDVETIGYWIEALEEDTDRLNMFERFQKMSKGCRD